jgi:hypothetical protein
MDSHSYHIWVHGHPDERWFAWFSELRLDHRADGTTLISATQLDQATLHAMLNRIRDLGLELLAVQRDGFTAERQASDDN